MANEQSLSPFCDYCGQRFPGSIIESQAPCAACMGEHGAEVVPGREGADSGGSDDG